ncbi:MAG: hypothetical protein ACP5HX_09580, partial [Thermoproteota archaeon]
MSSAEEVVKLLTEKEIEKSRLFKDPYSHETVNLRPPAILSVSLNRNLGSYYFLTYLKKLHL